MKTKSLIIPILALLSAFSLQPLAFAQGPAFTYQGRLTDGGLPYSGTAEFQFTLWNASSDGAVVATNNPASLIAQVTNGLFTVLLDFGAGAFPGADRWVQVELRTSIGPFTTLTSRQQVTAVPYALTAGNLAGPLPASQLSGTLPSANLGGTYGGALTFDNSANSFGGRFAGNGADLTNLNAAQIASGIVPDARLAANVARTNQVWLLGGNAGSTPGTQFIGTTDSQPVELWANGERVLRLELNGEAPNIIGGSVSNRVAPGVVGATIAGGGLKLYPSQVTAIYGTVGGGSYHTVGGIWGTVAGGRDNNMLADHGTIAGGRANQMDTNASNSTIGGGYANRISTNGQSSTIGGGWRNVIDTDAASSTIAGGFQNSIGTNSVSGAIGGGSANTIASNAYAAIIPGGVNNFATAFAFAAGNRAKALHPGSFVWADNTAADFATTGNSQFLVRATGGVGINTNNPSGSALNVNGIVSATGFTGSGAGLTGLSGGGLVAGSVSNAALASNAVTTDKIADGTVTAADLNPALLSTTFWRVGGNAGTTAGTHFAGTTDNQPLELRVNNLRALRLEPNTNSPNVIGGYSGNLVGAAYYGSTIGGGGNLNYSNVILASYATIAGGRRNNIDSGADHGAIGGGLENSIATNAWLATIAGGSLNDVGTASYHSAIGGGYNNNIGDNSTYATIAGGQVNDIGLKSDYGTIGGGYNNNIAANSTYATIAGGRLNDVGTNSAYGTIAGGYDNNIAANSTYGTIAGGRQNDIGTSSAYSAIGGGYNNNIGDNSTNVTIAGGYWNQIGTNCPDNVIGGGSGNSMAGRLKGATIAGGSDNAIGFGSYGSAIGGGWVNKIGDDSLAATIAGGDGNNIGANSSHAIIAGGWGNVITDYSYFGTIPGGYYNQATNYAFAAGYHAKAIHTGAFVWGDFNASDVASTAPNSVTMRAEGGYRFFSSSDTTAPAPGVQLAAGASSWSTISDRAAKKDVAPVDAAALLDKLAHVPVFQWHYQWEETAATPHLGPMAQDFKAAFYPGRDDKSITTLEFDGVALAAIQGLNQKVEEQASQLKAKETQLQEQQKQINALLSRLGALEEKLASITTK